MSGLHKFKRKKIGLLTAFSIFCIVLTSGKLFGAGVETTKTSFQVKDTVPKTTVIGTDTIPRRNIDSIATSQRIDTFSLKMSKDTLDAPVEYEAEDSAVLLVKDQK